MTVQQPALSGHCSGLKVAGGGDTAAGTEGQGGCGKGLVYGGGKGIVCDGGKGAAA